MSRVLLLLLQATWKYLAVALALLLAMAFLDLGRDALGEAQRRREALAALDAGDAAAQRDLEAARAEALATRSQRGALQDRLLAESRSTLSGQDGAVRSALALKEQALAAAERERQEVERRVLGAAQGAVTHAQEARRRACAEAGYVGCNLAKLALYLRHKELDDARAGAQATLDAVARRTASLRGEVGGLEGQLERLQQAWADPLDDRQRDLLARADAAVRGAEASESAIERALEATRQEAEGLRAARGPADRILETWNAKRAQILAAALGILLLPLALRSFWYFGLMGLAERGRSIQLVPPDADGAATADPPEPRLTLTVQPGDVLRVRSGFVTRREGTPDTELVFGGWSHPFSSLASGLVTLDRFRPTDTPWHVTLGDDEPDTQLLVLRLDQHPGFVVHPAHVVAILGQPRVLRRWRLGHLHAWMTFQFRYLLFEGSGAVVLAGLGHLEGESVQGNAAGVASARVLGFDGRLAYRTARTRPFFPYLVGNRPLTEDLFDGEHLFVSGKVDPAGARKDPLQRLLSLVFGALEKALGIG